MKQRMAVDAIRRYIQKLRTKLNSPKRRRDLGSKKKGKHNEHSHGTAKQIVDFISITF